MSRKNIGYIDLMEKVNNYIDNKLKKTLPSIDKEL
jgi:hypothetical protein